MSARQCMITIVFVAILILARATAEPHSAGNDTTVCQTDECWRMSASLHESLNTSANPCDNFEEFLCGGFRSSHQLTGDSLLSGRSYLDYMRQTGSAYSERVTEQLATSCWGSDCLDTEMAVDTKLRVYENVAHAVLVECVQMEAFGNATLQTLVKENVHQVIEEAIDLGIEGISAREVLRFENLLPKQSAKSLLSPLTAAAGVAYRDGRPAILIVAVEPFLGLRFIADLLGHFPMQTSRLLRQLRMPLPGSLFGLVRHAQANIQLWDYVCNRTATNVLNLSGNQSDLVRTVADAKRLLQLANLTFDLDEFLRLSVGTDQSVSNSTDIVLTGVKAFLHTICMLDQCTKRQPNLIKVLVIHQITSVAVKVLSISNDASCIDELFGVASEPDGSSIDSFEGVFRPLLHGRYARSRRSKAAEVEASDIFKQLKSTYATVIAARAWIPSQEKSALLRRVQMMQLNFQVNTVSEASLVRHYRSVMDEMPARRCSLSVNPACLLVRARALQMYLVMRSTQSGFDNESPHYNYLKHAVFLTPAFTDPPHYRTSLPLAVRLGSLGFVLAHELTHGVLSEPTQWTEDFASQYRSRENCLRRRLKSALGLNKTSLEEDVADQIGLSVAHRTLIDSADDDRLPGYMARYSPAQLLYMTSMRIFCTKASPGFWRSFKSVASEQIHLQGKFRFRAMLSGDAEFKRVFGCPKTSGPVDRPEVSDVEDLNSCKFW